MSFKTAQSKLAQIRSRQEGVTALEYAMIAALIAVMIVGAVTTSGSGANFGMQSVSNQLPSAAVPRGGSTGAGGGGGGGNGAANGNGNGNNGNGNGNGNNGNGNNGNGNNGNGNNGNGNGNGNGN